MRVTALYRYPVKSLGGEALPHLAAEGRGFADDRRWMLVDPQGRFISQRTHHHLATYTASLAEDNVLLIKDASGQTFAIRDARTTEKTSTTVTVWDDEVTAGVVPASGLGSFLGIPDTRLVYMGADSLRPVDARFARDGEMVSFADGFPYLITTDSSLRELERRVGYPLSMLRFRPNIVIDGSAPFAEDDWTRLRIGATTMRLPKPCARCIMVTLEPGTGAKDLSVLSTLAAFRRVGNKTMFGMNAVTETAGSVIRVGDAVENLAN